MGSQTNEEYLEIQNFSEAVQRKSTQFKNAPGGVQLAVNASFGRIGGVEKILGYAQLGNTITTSSSSSTTSTSTSTSTSSSSTTTSEIEILVDYYPESNYNNGSAVYADVPGIGQSFTATGGILDSVQFYLIKVGVPTGNATCKIYAESHATAFGTDSLPTGSSLASCTYDVATIPDDDFHLIEFKFTGENKITLVNGTKYICRLEYTGGDEENFVGFGFDDSSPSHAGNSVLLVGEWGADPLIDCIFYVYKDG
jgi:hypothetical protein